MQTHTYRTFQALILAGSGIFLLGKILDGRILLYINRRFVLLVILAALGLMFLAQWALRSRGMPGEVDEKGEEHEHGNNRRGQSLWLLALPLLVGVLLPERALGAQALEMRGVTTLPGAGLRGSSEISLSLPPAERSILDWLRAANAAQESTELEGQPIDVTGFVYHDERLGAQEFLVTRFGISCCVADAMAVGIPVRWSDAAGLSQNSWVRVRGLARVVWVDGVAHLSIEAQSVESVPEPLQPYLFP